MIMSKVFIWGCEVGFSLQKIKKKKKKKKKSIRLSFFTNLQYFSRILPCFNPHLPLEEKVFKDPTPLSQRQTGSPLFHQPPPHSHK